MTLRIYKVERSHGDSRTLSTLPLCVFSLFVGGHITLLTSLKVDILSALVSGQTVPCAWNDTWLLSIYRS